MSAGTTTAAAAPAAGPGPWRAAGRRFLLHRPAVASVAVLAFITLACLLGPALSPHAFDSVDWQQMSVPPAWSAWRSGHWFGTDELGRDLLVRTLVGGRVSLLVGLLATLVTVCIGVAWGAVAGFVGGRVDAVMMRIVDMAYAVPTLLIAILVVTALGRDVGLVVLSIAAFSWLDMARVVRGQALAIRSREYIEAARALGAPVRHILLQHVLPNLAGVVLVYASIVVPNVILAESVLSFLGLGVQEPMTSWGVLVHDGGAVMGSAPWMLLFPAGALVLTLYCASFIGDGLRDALDPQQP